MAEVCNFGREMVAACELLARRPQPEKLAPEIVETERESGASGSRIHPAFRGAGGASISPDGLDTACGL